MARVGRTAASVGSHLGATDAVRVRAEEARALIAAAALFDADGPPQLGAVFTDDKRLGEAAPLTAKLLALVEGGAAAGLAPCARSLDKLHAFASSLENRVVAQFDAAEARRDAGGMRAAVQLMASFNGGGSLVARFVATRRVFMAGMGSPGGDANGGGGEGMAGGFGGPPPRGGGAANGGGGGGGGMGGGSAPDGFGPEAREACDEGEAASFAARSVRSLAQTCKELLKSTREEAALAAAVWTPSPEAATQALVRRLLEQRVRGALDATVPPHHDGSPPPQRLCRLLTLAGAAERLRELAERLAALPGCGGAANISATADGASSAAHPTSPRSPRVGTPRSRGEPLPPPPPPPGGVAGFDARAAAEELFTPWRDAYAAQELALQADMAAADEAAGVAAAAAAIAAGGGAGAGVGEAAAPPPATPPRANGGGAPPPPPPPPPLPPLPGSGAAAASAAAAAARVPLALFPARCARAADAFARAGLLLPSPKARGGAASQLVVQLCGSFSDACFAALTTSVAAAQARAKAAPPAQQGGGGAAPGAAGSGAGAVGGGLAVSKLVASTAGAILAECASVRSASDALASLLASSASPLLAGGDAASRAAAGEAARSAGAAAEAALRAAAEAAASAAAAAATRALAELQSKADFAPKSVGGGAGVSGSSGAERGDKAAASSGFRHLAMSADRPTVACYRVAAALGDAAKTAHACLDAPNGAALCARLAERLVATLEAHFTGSGFKYTPAGGLRLKRDCAEYAGALSSWGVPPGSAPCLRLGEVARLADLLVAPVGTISILVAGFDGARDEALRWAAMRADHRQRGGYGGM